MDLGHEHIRCWHCLGVAPVDFPVLAKREVLDARTVPGLQTPKTVNLEASGSSAPVLNMYNGTEMTIASFCSAPSESCTANDSPIPSDVDHRSTGAVLRWEEAAKQSAEDTSLTETNSSLPSTASLRWSPVPGSRHR